MKITEAYPDAKGVLSQEAASDWRAMGIDARTAYREFGVMYPIAGSADNPASYPLGAPTVSGTTVTVDVLLNQPTRITRVVNDIVASHWFLDRIFTRGGEVQGGALLYDRVTTVDTYSDRDVERIEPGMEAPIVTGARQPPRVATVEKYGGKFPVPEEARDRNMLSAITNATRQLANTIVRKMHQRGLAEIAAAITEHSRTGAGLSWGDALALTETTRAANLEPAYDFAQVQEANENNELGYVYDTIIVNPRQATQLRTFYSGRDGRASLSTVLGDMGITDMISTPRKTIDSAYVLASGQVGEMRLEKPLRTVVVAEGAPDLREQEWVQSTVRPVMAVTDPYAVFELTGLSA